MPSMLAERAGSGQRVAVGPKWYVKPESWRASETGMNEDVGC
jgi:hypothetical protein